MQDDQLKKELQDYFLRQGRFKMGRKLVGMSGSQYPGFFINFFHSLNEKEQERMIQLLVRIITTDDYPEFSQGLLHVMSLLGRFAIRREYKHLQPHQKTFEGIFLDKHNLETWANCGEEFSEGGKEYLRSWRFALVLFCLLKQIGSSAVDEGYNYLVAHAKSEHFRQALVGNWEMIVVRGK